MKAGRKAGREKKKDRRGGGAGQTINLKGHGQSRKGPWRASRGPQQC